MGTDEVLSERTRLAVENTSYSDIEDEENCDDESSPKLPSFPKANTPSIDKITEAIDSSDLAH
jgi:hypothetical protein